MLEVGKYYRWCKSKHKLDEFDTAPSDWFKVTLREDSGYVHIEWDYGVLDKMHERFDENRYIPEVKGIGEYESDERREYFSKIKEGK